MSGVQDGPFIHFYDASSPASNAPHCKNSTIIGERGGGKEINLRLETKGSSLLVNQVYYCQRPVFIHKLQKGDKNPAVHLVLLLLTPFQDQ